MIFKLRAVWVDKLSKITLHVYTFAQRTVHLKLLKVELYSTFTQQIKKKKKKFAKFVSYKESSSIT